MTRRELKELIAEGESLTVEFKRKFTTHEKIARELIAFANTSGGWLLIGVDDDQYVVGIESEKEEISLVEDVCANSIEPPLRPTIEVVQIHHVDVVVVRVEESTYKPHHLLTTVHSDMFHNGAVYIRQADKSVQAGKEMIKILESQRSDSEPVTLSIGKHEKHLFEFFETHERITAKQYADLCNISERRAMRLLVRLVRIGMIFIHTQEKTPYYTLAG